MNFSLVKMSNNLLFEKVKFAFIPFSTVIVLYLVITGFYPELNILNFFQTKKHEYRFYSGSPAGSYYSIGKYLSENSKLLNDRLVIKNKVTEAGYQNSLRVLSDPYSFGIVQGDVIRETDIIKKELRYIAPLYLERMHIIYNEKSYSKYILDKGRRPNLSTTISVDLLKYFADSKINVGPSGGGTCILASYIIKEINSQIKDNNLTSENQKVVYLPIGDAFHKMEDTTSNNNIDIAFYMGGSPNDEVKTLLEKGYKLMQLDLSLITKININYNLNLRFTNFNKKYYASDILTFGSYAYLITQKTTPDKDIVALLDNLISIDKNNRILGANNSEIDDLRKKISDQVEDYSFFDAYGKIKNDYTKRKITVCLLFFAIFFIAYGISNYLSKYSISNKYKKIFFSKLNSITHRNIPDNIIPVTVDDIENYVDKDRETKNQITNILESNSDKNDDKFCKVPFIQDNQIIVINRIIMGISSLFALRNEINDAFHEKRLTNNDYLFLLHRSDHIVEKLRKSLGIRVKTELNSKLAAKTDSVITKSLINKYYTADYLLKSDYDELLKFEI